jgi:hypothetical protein
VNDGSIIDALKHTITAANGTTGDDDAGNVLANDNGNGTDTLNGSPVTIGLVTFYHYTSNGYQWWKCTNHQSRNCSSASKIRLQEAILLYTKSVIN